VINKDKNIDHETLAKESVDESELNLAAVKETFKGFYSEINTNEKNKSVIIEEVAVNFLFNYLRE
jgi:hypothetical protein